MKDSDVLIAGVVAYLGYQFIKSSTGAFSQNSTGGWTDTAKTVVDTAKTVVDTVTSAADTAFDFASGFYNGATNGPYPSLQPTVEALNPPIPTLQTLIMDAAAAATDFVLGSSPPSAPGGFTSDSSGGGGFTNTTTNTFANESNYQLSFDKVVTTTTIPMPDKNALLGPFGDHYRTYATAMYNYYQTIGNTAMAQDYYQHLQSPTLKDW